MLWEESRNAHSPNQLQACEHPQIFLRETSLDSQRVERVGTRAIFPCKKGGHGKLLMSTSDVTVQRCGRRNNTELHN